MGEKELVIIKMLGPEVTSSADVERIVSTFAHSKLRNQLGIEKAIFLLLLLKTLSYRG